MELERVNLSLDSFFLEIGVVECLACGVPLRYAEAYADLDGPTQRSFYCWRCAERSFPRVNRSQSVAAAPSPGIPGGSADRDRQSAPIATKSDSLRRT